jgi:hypothetical protein
MNIKTQDVLRAMLLVGCAYEIVALTTRKVPTVTRILKTVGSKPYGKAALWLWTGYVSAHFLEPLDERRPEESEK